MAIALYVLLGFTALDALPRLAAFLIRARRWDDIANGDWDTAGTPHAIPDALALYWEFARLPNIALMVLFVIWFHRVRANVDCYRDAPAQTLSPGWALGGWFCPAANLWFPALMTMEVWRASDPRARDRGGSTPGRLPLVWAWWLTVAGSMVLTIIGYLMRANRDGDDVVVAGERVVDAEVLRTSALISAAGTALYVVAAVLAIAVVVWITGFQHERARDLGRATFGPPFGLGSHAPVPAAPGWGPRDERGAVEADLPVAAPVG